jgi:hypothetical protein
MLPLHGVSALIQVNLAKFSTRTDGIVTLRPRAEKGWPVDATSRDNVAPASKRLGSEGLQRTVGYQMALNVELVVDGAMNREELSVDAGVPAVGLVGERLRPDCSSARR